MNSDHRCLTLQPSSPSLLSLSSPIFFSSLHLSRSSSSRSPLSTTFAFFLRKKKAERTEADLETILSQKYWYGQHTTACLTCLQRIYIPRSPVSTTCFLLPLLRRPSSYTLVLFFFIFTTSIHPLQGCYCCTALLLSIGVIYLAALDFSSTPCSLFVSRGPFHSHKRSQILREAFYSTLTRLLHLRPSDLTRFRFRNQSFLLCLLPP